MIHQIELPCSLNVGTVSLDVSCEVSYVITASGPEFRYLALNGELLELEPSQVEEVQSDLEAHIQIH